jgi:hypothetical protein
MEKIKSKWIEELNLRPETTRIKYRGNTSRDKPGKNLLNRTPFLRK